MQKKNTPPVTDEENRSTHFTIKDSDLLRLIFLPLLVVISAWALPTHCKTTITPTRMSTVFTPAISIQVLLSDDFFPILPLSLVILQTSPRSPADSVTLQPLLLLLKQKPGCAALAALCSYFVSACATLRAPGQENALVQTGFHLKYRTRNINNNNRQKKSSPLI